jgi:hypothetical protein
LFTAHAQKDINVDADEWARAKSRAGQWEAAELRYVGLRKMYRVSARNSPAPHAGSVSSECAFKRPPRSSDQHQFLTKQTKKKKKREKESSEAISRKKVPLASTKSYVKLSETTHPFLLSTATSFTSPTMLVFHESLIKGMANFKTFIRSTGAVTALALLVLATAANVDAAQENAGTVVGIDLGTTYSW